MKTSIKASLIAAAIATLPFGSQAAGLGSINVFSGLGQPLRAEIELNATPQEVQTLAARIAPVEAFRQANVSYSPVLTDIRVSVESRGNRSVLKLSSDRPVNEPFVDLLLELNWASGRLLREYTFLLDPVQLQAPPVVAAPRPAMGSAAPSATMRPETPVRERVAAPVADRYQVKRGDTLRGIADKHRPQSVNLDQMLIALFRENPAAFDEGNVNRLRAGAILQIPNESAAGAVEPAQARREIVAQAADFEAYRRSLASAVAARPAAAESEGSRSGGGAIVPAVDEPQRLRDTGDRVKVTGAPSSGTSAAATPPDDARLARLQALEEELVARDKALEEANARLVALETSIRDMQQLLSLRSQGLAQVQGQAAGATTEAPAAEPPATLASPVAAPTEPVAQAPAPVEPAPAAEPESQPEPSFLQALLQDPLTLAGGGGILALLLGYGGYKVRQRRKAEEGVRDSMAMISEMPPESKSVFGATGGQSVNTTDSSVIQTDFSQSGLSAIDADEGVDPVAEADVYMAYGRDAQAEEILLDALKADAARLAIYLKLLEIYAQRKALKQFETVATDLYSRTDGEGAEWTKAAELGRKIDSENPLYRATAGEGRAISAGRPFESKLVDGGASVAALGGAAGVAVAAAIGTGDSVKLDSTASSDGEMIDLDFGADGSADDVAVAPVEPSPSQLKDTWAMPGDLSEVSRALDGGSDEDVSDAVNAAAKPEALAEALPEIDSDVLDFDLDAGLGLGEGAEGGAAAGEASELLEVAFASVGGADDLEFDLDIGDEGARVEAKPDAEPLMDATMVGDGLDFLSGMDADQGLGEDAAASAESDGFDLNATLVQSAEPVSDTDSETMDLEKTSFDSSLLDFDFDIESTKPEGLPEAPSLDLTSIDLDLEPHDDNESPTEADEGVIGSDAEIIDMPELSDEIGEDVAESASEAPVGEPSEEVIQEVDTKLELARAYEEMGDKDGARELVEEVLREGSSAQREAAKLLMERLV